ncbi:MAG: xylulokinase [Actinomycetaceae bacterium]|nr:xylulokinase [Actinomycetaceae bacterium]
MRRLVAGVDTSTQSCKVLVVDAQTKEIVRSGSASHPDGTEVNPAAWWEAFKEAAKAAGGLADVEAISVGGQQHGMVTLDADGEVVRDALLWNDTRSAGAARDLIDELTGEAWAEACGSTPVASLTVTKLRWFVDNEPEAFKRVAAVCLPHDYLSWKLSGSKSIEDLFTDRSDASGTGYLDLRTGEYRYDLLAHALRMSEEEAKRLVLPKVVEPFQAGGVVQVDDEETGLRAGTLIGPGCGDNAGAALGLDLKPGEASVSIGTSGVVAAVADKPIWDRNGVITGFMDATGNWLPLAATLNGARVIASTAALLGVSFEEFDELALSVPDAGGLKMVPYFEGERTPNLPHATAEMSGMTLANWTRPHLARAAVEALAELMHGAAQALIDCGVELDRVRLIGGGARSQALRKVLPEVLGVAVDVPEPAEYVALGAAKQAAAVLQAS